MNRFPDAFLQQINKLLPLEHDAFLNSLQEHPKTSIRLNPKKIVQDKSGNIPWSKNGFILDNRPNFTLDPLIHAGAYYVQEASSMIIGYVIDLLIETNYANENIVVLDLCAAPGGKSTDILSVISEESILVANEVIQSRASILKENITKFGAANVIVTQSDSGDFARLGELFDIVVVDAPCSGEGMFRKDPLAIEEWSLEHVHLCSERQKRIVQNAWQSLKPNGFLIYSTCTYNKQEDENMVEYLLDEFNATRIKLPIDEAWGITDVDLGYKFYPHKCIGEGFFVSVIQKNEQTNNTKLNTKTKLEILKPRENVYSDWVKNGEMFEWFKFQNKVKIIPKNFFQILNAIASNIKVIKAGLDVLEMKGKDAIPEIELAMSYDCNHSSFSQINVTHEEALKILRKEDFVAEGENGIHLILVDGLGICFSKKIGNRMNHYFPTDWRIRMPNSPNEVSSNVLLQLGLLP